MKTSSSAQRNAALGGPDTGSAAPPEPAGTRAAGGPDSSAGGPDSSAGGPDASLSCDPRASPRSEAADPSADAAAASSDERELADPVRALLTEFGRALQREAMYPANHPALEGSAAKLRELVLPALDGREEISIGVARYQLSVAGAATDPESPILSSLADKLHRHQISAVTLRRAVGTEEISALLAALSSDLAGETAPLRDQTWRHIRITFFPYEHLRLDTEGTSDLPTGEQTDVWLAFARAVLNDDSVELEGTMDTDRLAERMSELCPEEAYSGRVTERLLAVEQAISRDREQASVLESLTSDVVAKADPTALGQLLEHAGDSSTRRQILSAAARSLRAEAVFKLLLEARRFEERETPDAMWLVVSKLAQRSERGDASQQNQASGLLRDQVLELLTAWDTDEFMPADYTMELASVAATEGRRVREEDASSRTAIGSTRVLQMAIETQQPGAAVRRAANLLLRDGSLAAVLDVFEGAPAGNPATRQLGELIADPEILAAMLSEETLDFALIDRMLGVVGPLAAPAMLDAIAEGESRANRGRLFQRLVALGPEIGHEVVARLDDQRWYVRRNLLALLDDLGAPDGFSAVPFLDDEHEAVRRAAVKLVLKQPKDRERGIEAALASDDPRAVILGLVAAKHGCPAELVERIADLALAEDHSQELRLHATRALEGVRSETALQALVRIARRKRRWLVLRSADPPTPLELEALAVLRATWADEARAKRALSSRRDEIDSAPRAT